MKTKILIIILMTFSLAGFTQEEITQGGYGGPLIQVPNINGDWGIMIGGKGGFVFNQRFAIGGIGSRKLQTQCRETAGC